MQLDCVLCSAVYLAGTVQGAPGASGKCIAAEWNTKPVDLFNPWVKTNDVVPL
jgi:hypothetical protein